MHIQDDHTVHSLKRLHAGRAWSARCVCRLLQTTASMYNRLEYTPRPRASVHSRVTMQRTPFFLAIHVTCRGPDAVGGATATLKRAAGRKELRSCIVSRVNCQRNPGERRTSVGCLMLVLVARGMLALTQRWPHSQVRLSTVTCCGAQSKGGHTLSPQPKHRCKILQSLTRRIQYAIRKHTGDTILTTACIIDYLVSRSCHICCS